MSVAEAVTLGESTDAVRFRSVMARVPTSVAVVAGMEAGRPVGLTVGTFTSVSLDPPLVAICVGLGSTSWPRIEPVGRFGVSVLAADQTNVADAFAARGEDKFDGIGWSHGPHGLPWIDGSVAHLDCAIDKVFETGDHRVVIGRVLELQQGRTSEPMIFHDRRLGGVRHGC